MRSIKNFFHNINDILLAVIIVAIAVGIIYWRMNIILDYPQQLVNNQTVQEETEDAGDEALDETIDEAEAQG